MICNIILNIIFSYAKALDLERVKFIEETNNYSEIKKIENEERRKNLIQIENFYTNKIIMLQDILKKEKYERELQYRSQLQVKILILKKSSSFFRN